MAFPAKFRHLIELTAEEVEMPDYLWLNYAVCAVTKEGCGWGGWMIESAFRRDGQKHPTGTGDRLLSAADEQVCPRCGRETFGTAVELRVEPSSDQSKRLKLGIDYEVMPLEYEE
jgi:hypothetical protein